MVHLSEVNNMFWGLTIDGGKRYFQKVDKAYKVTMAALEVNLKAPKDTGSVQVMVQDGSSQFLLCTLGPAYPQQQLNLEFTFGESVQFFLKGEGVVHLTGFLLPDRDESDLSDMDDDSDADSELYDDDDDEDDVEWSTIVGSELYADDDDGDEWSPLAAGSKRKRNQLDGTGKKLKRLEEVPSLFDEEAWEEEDEESEEESEDSLVGNQSARSLKALQVSLPKKASSSETPAPSKKEKKKKDAKSQPAKADASAAGDTLNDSTSKKKNKKTKKNKPGENAAQQQESGAEKAAAAAEPPSPKPSPAVGKKRSVAGGTGVEDLKIGHGPEAKPGATVSVYYSGTLAKNNKRFDSCLKGKPFRFRLGRGEVIKGWDTGLIGMKVGGKRKITVPPSQGYGNARQGPIPPGSTLIFDVEMKAVS